MQDIYQENQTFVPVDMVIYNMKFKLAKFCFVNVPSSSQS